MTASRTVRVALPFAAPLVAVLALPVALALGARDVHAMDVRTDTSSEVFAITATAPGVSHALDGGVVTVFGHVDDAIEKRRLVTALERVEGVSRVIDIVKSN